MAPTYGLSSASHVRFRWTRRLNRSFKELLKTLLLWASVEALLVNTIDTVSQNAALYGINKAENLWQILQSFEKPNAL